jgi:hypothetical protein
MMMMKQRYELYIEEQATGFFQYMTKRQAKHQNELMREGSGLLHEYRLSPDRK